MDMGFTAGPAGDGKNILVLVWSKLNDKGDRVIEEHLLPIPEPEP